MHRLTNKDLDSMTALCSECGPTDIHFRSHRNTYICKTKKRADDIRRQRIKRYGADSAFLPFTGICPICQVNGRLVIDHDHETGKVRGTICARCNLGLGFFLDNKTSMQRAIDYLG